MRYLILLIFLTSCAEFPINVKHGELRDAKNQINCEPAESNGCAGWLPKE